MSLLKICESATTILLISLVAAGCGAKNNFKPKPATEPSTQEVSTVRTLTTRSDIQYGLAEFGIRPWYGPYSDMTEFCKAVERDCTDTEGADVEMVPKGVEIGNSKHPFLDVAVGSGDATVDGDIGLLVRTNVGWFAPYWYTSKYNGIKLVQAQVIDTAVGAVLQIDFDYHSGGKWGMTTSKEVLFCGVDVREHLNCTSGIYRHVEGELFWGSFDEELTEVDSNWGVTMDRSGILTIAPNGVVDSHYKNILGKWKLSFSEL